MIILLWHQGSRLPPILSLGRGSWSMSSLFLSWRSCPTSWVFKSAVLPGVQPVPESASRYQLLPMTWLEGSISHQGKGVEQNNTTEDCIRGTEWEWGAKQQQRNRDMKDKETCWSPKSKRDEEDKTMACSDISQAAERMVTGLHHAEPEQGALLFHDSVLPERSDVPCYQPNIFSVFLSSVVGGTGRTLWLYLKFCWCVYI